MKTNGHPPKTDRPEPHAMWHSLTYYVAENPWYLVALAGIVAAGFLLALRVTQDGRYLTRALVALGVAGVLIAVDQLWVTEAERVGSVVYQLGRAMARSDGDATLALMDEHVTFSMRSNIFGEELELGSVVELLGKVKFDFIRISRLVATAGEQTHRGQAEFKVMAAGTIDQGSSPRPFAGYSEWSLGFRRIASGAWKINRITSVELPQYTMLPIIRVRIPQTATQPAKVEPIAAPPLSRPFRLRIPRLDGGEREAVPTPSPLPLPGVEPGRGRRDH
jgi:hypothetical protein